LEDLLSSNDHAYGNQEQLPMGAFVEICAEQRPLAGEYEL